LRVALVSRDRSRVDDHGAPFTSFLTPDLKWRADS
jgi:hypothetical protein